MPEFENPPPPLFFALLGVILLPLFVAPLALALGRRLGRFTGYLAMTGPLASLGILVWIAYGWTAGAQQIVSVPWVPSLQINLSFLIDGLSLFYGLVISGIGVLVCWYAAQYFDRAQKSLGWFFGCLLAFMTAMLGAVFSNNLILLFAFWELTGIASFLLIGFLHGTEKARLGARRALLVTVATGLALLAGLILLGLQGGTYEFDALRNRLADFSRTDPTLITLAGLLILTGAFGKSAQFPFQFWLPGAMAAPTPVSAYLHSATMVKLGVFLTARMFPVFSSLDFWLPLVAGVGLFTMLLGAFLALRANDLKEILAYSTVSQLGFLIGVYGIGSAQGVRFDFVHVISHVFYKGSLFMVAGIIDHSTGTRDVRKLGGLGRLMPLTAFAGLIGTAALAGLPLTTGFISKEIMLADLGRLAETTPLGWVFLGLVALSAVFTVAFALRLFTAVFTGNKPAGLHFHAPGLALQIPPVLLAGAALFFGIFPGPLGRMLDVLSATGLHAPAEGYLALWHGFNRELLLSAVVIASGILLFLWAKKTEWRWATTPRWLQFDRMFDAGVDGLSLFSKKLTLALKADWPPAYLPIVIFSLLLIIFGAVIVNSAAFVEGIANLEWKFDPLRSFVGLLITLGLGAVLILRRWTSQLIALSVSGFFLTFYFVLYHAPDLAMTQILVESASVVMILVLVSRFSGASRAGTRFEFSLTWAQIIRTLLALGMGVLGTGLVLFAEVNKHPDPVGPKMREFSKPLAEGTNAVNTILVDFRGFDTMGEITVLLIAALAGIGLMMRYKQSASAKGGVSAPGFLLGKDKKP
jgi:NADH:ubiquinone oxidoreductase subunit 5 (subunit L)/multisubunit Na+/H+ antiporter MnhA subunit/uncharacterized MnhB-related membrane protein